MTRAAQDPDLTLVRAEQLRPLIARVFTAVGVPEADSETVAEVLVEADLRGVESHGSTRVAGYVSMIERALLNPRPKVQVLRQIPSTAMLERDNGFGIVVAKRAMEMAIPMSRVVLDELRGHAAAHHVPYDLG